MRTIRRSSAFQRDFRRILANSRHGEAERLLQVVGDSRAADEALPRANRDDPLSGNWITYRECHVRADLLLIFRKPDAHTLSSPALGRTATFSDDAITR